MVDLDSNPTKLLEVVEVGKQLLMTRGSLTTFSIANDVAKYFAILPAMFMGVYPADRAAQRHAPGVAAVAILSAVIFNAIIIVVLIPLALRGVKYRPLGAAASAAPVAADLRRRRRDRAVRRHQADRSRARRDGSRCNRQTLLVALRATLVTLVLTGLVYPLVVTGAGAADVPAPRERLARHRRQGRRRRLRADRAGVRAAARTSSRGRPAERLRRDQLGRHEPRVDVEEAARRRR